MMKTDLYQKQEERHYKARVLKATDADIERFEQVAQSFGPCTTLPNGEVYDAIWFVGLNSLAQGRPLIPQNAERWAEEVWLALCNVGVIRSWEVGPIFELKHVAEQLWG
jgi:hypothetical protein